MVTMDWDKKNGCYDNLVRNHYQKIERGFYIRLGWRQHT